MAYKKEIIDEAFALYCQGLSFDKILTEMRKTRRRNFKLSRRTIVEWAEKEAWENRRELLWRQAGEKRDSNIVDSLGDVLEQLTGLADHFERELLKSRPSTSAALGGVILKIYDKLVKYQGLLGSGGDNIAIIVKMMLDIMERDEDGKRWLEKKQNWLIEQLEHEAQK